MNMIRIVVVEVCVGFMRTYKIRKVDFPGYSQTTRNAWRIRDNLQGRYARAFAIPEGQTIFSVGSSSLQ